MCPNGVFEIPPDSGQDEELLERGGNRNRDLSFASSMRCQLSDEVKSVRANQQWLRNGKVLKDFYLILYDPGILP